MPRDKSFLLLKLGELAVHASCHTLLLIVFLITHFAYYVFAFEAYNSLSPLFNYVFATAASRKIFDMLSYFMVLTFGSIDNIIRINNNKVPYFNWRCVLQVLKPVNNGIIFYCIFNEIFDCFLFNLVNLRLF